MFTKRTAAFFAIFFVVWYPTSLIIVTAYQATSLPVLFIAGSVFTPLWLLLVSYIYFRDAQNDWTHRVSVSILWTVLAFLFSAILVQPVYGEPWTSIINLEVLNANWFNIVAIIVGGYLAHRPGQ